MPELANLDDATLAKVAGFVQRLRESVDDWADWFLRLVRQDIAGYDVLSDDEIRDNARSLLQEEVLELSSLRIPDDALRHRLQDMALQRAAQGMSPEVLTLGYQLGSRELLVLMDRLAEEVGLPFDLLLAVHDSTWEFANEAAAVFARVQRDLSVEQAGLDAEHRSRFARSVLTGSSTAEQIRREAPLFGLDPRAGHVAVAARASSSSAGESVRRAIAQAVRVPPDRLVLSDLGSNLGCITSVVPEGIRGHLVAVGPTLPLDELARGFDDALLALGTAERLGWSGVVRLADLGPMPLVLAMPSVAARLEAQHLTPLADTGQFGADIEQTMRVLIECDQQVDAVARRLTLHPNTVRYRANRFRDLTGLDIRRTQDLVTAWWLLNRRRGAPRQP